MSAVDMVTTPPPGVGGDVQLAAKKAYNNALIKLNNQRQGVLRNFGYTANFDPSTGQMSGLNVDASNPYGQLQLTLRQQSLEDDSARNDALSRGIHGGLANQASTDLQYAHHGQTSQLASELMGQMGSFSDQQRQANVDYDNTLYNAQLEASRNAILKQMFNTPAYDDSNDDSSSKKHPPNNDRSGSNQIPTTTADINAYIQAATRAAKINPKVYIHFPGAGTPAKKKVVNTLVNSAGRRGGV